MDPRHTSGATVPLYRRPLGPIMTLVRFKLYTRYCIFNEPPWYSQATRIEMNPECESKRFCRI